MDVLQSTFEEYSRVSVINLTYISWSTVPQSGNSDQHGELSLFPPSPHLAAFPMDHLLNALLRSSLPPNLPCPVQALSPANARDATSICPLRLLPQLHPGTRAAFPALPEVHVHPSQLIPLHLLLPMWPPSHQ